MTVRPCGANSRTGIPLTAGLYRLAAAYTFVSGAPATLFGGGDGSGPGGGGAETYGDAAPNPITPDAALPSDRNGTVSQPDRAATVRAAAAVWRRTRAFTPQNVPA
ncbi:hypothetical protein GCM10027589_32030 [Actinocorallia lasiicapitis]